MPKHQTIAAQAARKDARAGAKYTTALRARQQSTTAAPSGAPVLQFLAKRSGDFYQLIGGITTAWANSGQRVLLLQEADDRLEWLLPRRGRRKQERPAPPEPETTTLWEQPAGPGTLVLHTCMWKPRGPERDRSLLKTAVDEARHAYDVIVLLPRRGWSYPDRETATAFVVLAEVDDFPHTDCRVTLPDMREEHGVPLNPEQSAAVLRERCLSFLFGFPHLATPLQGVIWQVHRDLPVDAAYLAGVARDMDRAGLHTFGWTTTEGISTTHRQLPQPHQLQDPDFIQPYRKIAGRLHLALTK